MKQNFFIFTSILFLQVLSSLNAIDENLINLLNNYSRPFTILEITSHKAEYIFDIAKNYDTTCVLLSLSDRHFAISESSRVSSDNVVILNPNHFSLEMLETLGRCEYFDLIIVDDLPSKLKLYDSKTINLLLKLGNYLLIKTDESNYNKIKDTVRYSGSIVYENYPDSICFFYDKKGLDIARWNKKHMTSSGFTRYPVESDFEQKNLCKPGKFKDRWTQGINLMTFVMLEGVFPTHKMIQSSIRKLNGVKHSDLILGNMILQGRKIQTIDNDSKYSLKAGRGLEAAIKLFDNPNIFKNPELAYKDYSDFLNKKWD